MRFWTNGSQTLAVYKRSQPVDTRNNLPDCCGL